MILLCYFMFLVLHPILYVAHEVVHTDIRGLVPHPSSSRLPYFIEFVHANYIKYTWIYFLHQNLEAF